MSDENALREQLASQVAVTGPIVSGQKFFLTPARTGMSYTPVLTGRDIGIPVVSNDSEYLIDALTGMDAYRLD